MSGNFLGFAGHAAGIARGDYWQTAAGSQGDRPSGPRTDH